MSKLKVDKLQIQEKVSVNGRIYEALGTKLLGIVEVQYNGVPLFTRTIEENDILVNGAVYFLEKAGKQRASWSPVPLDMELGINTTVTKDSATLASEDIIGLCIGIDGCSSTYNTVKSVTRNSNKVPGMIPFRIVNPDLTGDTRDKYFMKKVVSGNNYYYGKKPESPGVLKVLYDDGTDVPINVHDLIITKGIDVYKEYTFIVDSKDVREYFLLRDGNTTQAKINSIGILTGYPVTKDGKTEYENVRCITTLNMENHELKDDQSTITFIYKFFAV